MGGVKPLFAVLLTISAATLTGAVTVRTAAQGPSAAVAGVVRSPAEGPLEGVVVSAKRAGSTANVSVVSDGQWRYAFPRNRLEPGAYSIRIRATGYELDTPAIINVASQRTEHADVTLRKTQDLASQLSNGEWFMSWPGGDEVKNGLLNCTQCHTLEPIARSRYTASEWVPIIERMSRYAQGSTRARPQLRPGRAAGSAILAQSMAGREGERPVQKELVAKTGEYLASINLSSSPTWRYSLQTYPRPSGKATRVVITEYDLPRPETLPH